LLLGPGGSGKSTIYRQVMNLYGDQMDIERLESFRPVIHSNVTLSLSQIVAAAQLMSGAPPFSPDSESARLWLQSLGSDSELELGHVSRIRAIWNDPAVKFAYEQRNRFTVLAAESLEYFILRIEEVCSPDYIPSFVDALRCRSSTTGIVETAFSIDGSKFVLIDVGGQRNERKKWLHCFDGVTSVMFVVALTDYDAVLYEDETMNRMTEALSVFEQTVNLDVFKSVDFILFLNKSDLFLERLKTVPLSTYFKEYIGPDSLESCTEFIHNEFKKRVKSSSKALFCHTTCATDTTSIKFTFHAVKNIIVKKNLEDTGLLS